MKTLSLSAVTIASIFTGASIFSGCSSDTKTLPSTEAGAGGGSSSGGHSSSNGGSGTSGASGSAGASAAQCTLAVGTTCDGKEDCPAGQRCCATLSLGGGMGMAMGAGTTAYTKFGCFPSCLPPDAGPAGDAGGVLGGFGGPTPVEICNPGDACENGSPCQTSTYLPGSFSRCIPPALAAMAMSGTPDATLKHNKGEVNCGKTVCGASEQCCIRVPVAIEPYCAPKSATCDCKAPDGGSGTPGSGGKGGATGSGGKGGAAGSGGASPKDSGKD